MTGVWQLARIKCHSCHGTLVGHNSAVLTHCVRSSLQGQHLLSHSCLCLGYACGVGLSGLQKNIFARSRPPCAPEARSTCGRSSGPPTRWNSAVETGSASSARDALPVRWLRKRGPDSWDNATAFNKVPHPVPPDVWKLGNTFRDLSLGLLLLPPKVDAWNDLRV